MRLEVGGRDCFHLDLFASLDVKYLGAYCLLEQNRGPGREAGWHSWSWGSGSAVFKMGRWRCSGSSYILRVSLP